MFTLVIEFAGNLVSEDRHPAGGPDVGAAVSSASCALGSRGGLSTGGAADDAA